jgi:hypothetical protein
MDTAPRILVAAGLPIAAAVALEAAIYEGHMHLLARTWLIAAISILVGALLLALAPWKPLTRLLAIAVYVPLAVLCFYIAAFAAFCTVGPCV